MKTDNALAGTGIVVLVLAVLSLLSCTPTTDSEPAEIDTRPVADNKDRAGGGPPPLVVDTSTPLLLEEPDEEQGASAVADTRAAAENTACLVCHANYRAELLVSWHAAADIGCARCHGESLAHKNDENNTTPPEIMYSTDEIGPFCRGCHKAPPKDDASRKEGELDKPDPDRTICTNCHGEHRMKVRTVIWDKKSGKLLRTNKE